MGNPVTHFEVVGKDGAALENFYREAFGWEMETSMPGYAMAHPGGEGGINGGIGTTPDGSPGHVTFYIEVSDLDATLTAIGKLGGRTLMGPDHVPGGPAI